MLPIVLTTLTCVLACLLVAGNLIRRSKTALGLALGLLPIAVMEAIYHLSLQASIRSCLERACLSAGSRQDVTGSSSGAPSGAVYRSSCFGQRGWRRWCCTSSVPSFWLWP